jgi:EmrB/QacA subfamily drug resistance transporter
MAVDREQAQAQAERGAAAQRPSRRGVIAFTGLVLGLLLATLDQSVVATALPTMVGKLGGESYFAWVITAYILAASVTTPLYGKLGDLAGRKRVYLTAVGLFLAGSVLCSLARSMGELVTARAVQGLGAGGLLVTVFALIADLFGPKQRAKYQGYAAGVFALSSVGGPLAGGALTDQFGWRAVFWVNVPVGLVSLTLVIIFLAPLGPRPGGLLRQLDYAGTVLLAAALTCIALVTTWGGSEYAWSSPVITGLSAGAVVLIAGWILAERRAPSPIIPLELFANPTFVIASTVALLGGLVILSAVNFLPLFLQLVTGASALKSGLLLLPMMSGLFIAAGVSGKVISKTGRYKWYPVASMAVTAVAMYLLSTMTVTTSRPAAIAYTFLLGAGSGLSMQVVVVAVQNTAAKKDLGSATATVTFARLLGSSLGAALFGAILNARLKTEIIRHLPPQARSRVGGSASITPGSLDKLPLAIRHGFAVAYGNSLDTVFLVTVPIASAGVIIALLMRDLPLHEDDVADNPGPGLP